MEILEAELSHVISHRISQFSQSGAMFFRGRTTCGVVVAGELFAPKLGYPYKFYGEYEENKNPKYAGLEFKFKECEPVILETKEGFIKYLRAHVDGIGERIATKIVERFGSACLDVCADTPERLLEIEGITPRIKTLITNHFTENSVREAKARARLAELFDGYMIPRRAIDRLINDFGIDATDVVTKNPYMLLDFPGVGWATGDSFARAKAGVPPDSVERQAAAIRQSLEVLATDGHTCAYHDRVKSSTYLLLRGYPSEEAWELALKTHVIETANEQGRKIYALRSYYEAEETIARRIRQIEERASPLPLTVERIAGEPGSPAYLSPNQQKGVEMVLNHGVCLLTGAPGSGKTFVISKIISFLHEIGLSVRFLAPTGKAAKRGAELLTRHAPGQPIESSTIHRALGVSGSEEDTGVPSREARIGRGRDEFGFQRNESNPLDEDFIVVDEASLLDVKLFAALLKAIKSGAHLVIVGDHNQLPSVGPGSALRDLLAADVPHVILNEIRRTSGAAVRACHSIKDGKAPKPCPAFDWVAGENWRHIEAETQHQIANDIEGIFRAALRQKREDPNHPFWKDHDPFWDIQVVTIQNDKIAVSCSALNERLSLLLNPQGHKQYDNSYGFTVGDKVIRVKNGRCKELVSFDQLTTEQVCRHEDNPESVEITEFNSQEYFLEDTYLVNGDMGRIVDILPIAGRPYVYVEFVTPRRLCRLSIAKCYLQLAYAITTHKAQGSGFPYVVVPVHESFYWDARKRQGLFTREWLYTSLSRVEKILTTVGQASAIPKAVSRKTIGDRQTQLAELIKREAEKSKEIDI